MYDEAPEAPETLLGNTEDTPDTPDTPTDTPAPPITEAQHQEYFEQIRRDEMQKWFALSNSWYEDAKNDPEIGGPQLQSNVARAQAALHRFDPSRTVSAWLASSGFGNHPEVLRLFTRISHAIKEDSFTEGAMPYETLPLEERMYGHWNP